MNEQEILYAMALTRINYFNLAGLTQLYQELGSATAIVENRNHIRDVLPDASPRLIEGLKGIDSVMKRAETELTYDIAHQIQPIVMNDARYPQRLKECDDAFYKSDDAIHTVIRELNQEGNV